jgi:hypothetical protein
MTKIQLYNGVKDNKGNEIEIKSILQTINGPSNVFPIKKVREALIKLKHAKELFTAGTLSKEEVGKLKLIYEAEKTALPGVTWSGLFAEATAIQKADDIKLFLAGKLTWPEIHQKKKFFLRTRAEEQIKYYNGYIVIDIDKLESLEELKTLWQKLSKDSYVHILFVSPSGNGLKIVFRTDAQLEQHRTYFAAIEQYFKVTYDKIIDTSGKDVSRLCFLSSDKNLLIVQNSKLFDAAALEKNTIQKNPLTEKEQTNLSKFSAKEKTHIENNGQTLNDIFDSTQQVIALTDGNRNNFIFKFACNCNRAGIDADDCISFANSFATDKSNDEIKATVKSAYKKNYAEHGKYKKQSASTNIKKNSNQVANRNVSVQVTPGNKQNKSTNTGTAVDADFKFWIEHKTKKGKGKAAYEIIRLELRRVDFCKFLFAQGLHLYTTGKNEGFQIVHSGEGIIKPLTPQQVKHFALDWCKKHDLEEVEEMLRKGQKNYFAMNELDSLPYKEVSIATDTAEESYFYFKNCMVTVDNKGNLITANYDSSSDKFIWEANKVDFDFKEQELKIYHPTNGTVVPHTEMDCEFAKFVSLVSWNPNNDEEKNFTPELKTQRFESICSSIGFLLDGYKHPANRKGIFAIDHKIGDQFEQNGRTGKSIIPQACNLLKKAATINGKTYDPKYQFALELITIDSQIVNFNDMRSNFDPENIFELIADDYNVNCRNTGFIHFKYKSSPKVFVSTNHIPKGQGGSYTGRMHIIEFSDYFSPTHTPYDEFGRSLFPDDDKAEMLRLYNFLLSCVALFKAEGLITYPKGNYDARKLTSEVAQEFLDFMDDASYVARNVEQEKIKLLTSFNEKIYFPQNNKKISAHTFTKWVKHYCKTKGLKLNPHKNGGRDSRNSIEYYIIADASYKAAQQNLDLQ